MVGSEYTWLIDLNCTSDGIPRVRLARRGMFTLAVGFFCLLCFMLQFLSPETPDKIIPVTPVMHR